MQDERSVLRGLVQSLEAKAITSTEQLLTLLLDPLHLLLTSSDGTQQHESLTDLINRENVAGSSAAGPDTLRSSVLQNGSLLKLEPAAELSRHEYKAWSSKIDTKALRKRMLASSFLEDIQYLLLTEIAVTWSERLPPGIWNTILKAYFFPPAMISSAKQEVTFGGRASRILISELQDAKPPSTGELESSESRSAHLEVLHAAALLTCASFNTLTRLLTEAAHANELPQRQRQPRSVLNTAFSVLQIVADGKVSLKDVERGILAGESSPTRRHLLWTDAVKAWVSIPVRLANATQGRVPDSLQPNSFLAALAEQAEGLVHALTTGGQHTSQESKRNVAFCFTRLIRVGFANTLPRGPSRAELRSTFWGSILPSIQNRVSSQEHPDGSKEYSAAWLSTIDELDSVDQTALRRSLPAFLEALWNLRTPSGNDSLSGPDLLVTHAEKRNRGTEGKSFLGPARGARSASAALIFRTVFGKLTTKSRFVDPASLGLDLSDEGDDATEDEDEDESRERFTSVLQEMILPRTKMRSSLSSPSYGPSLARAFVYWAQVSAAEVETHSSDHIERILEAAVALWGDAGVVKIMNQKEDTYLSVLILGLAAVLDKTAAKASPSRPSAAKKALKDLTRLPAFSKGVAAHLDHGIPEVKRMGMLVAECVAELSSRHRSAGDENAVKLDFGKSVWDGVGEGREEARVLRALCFAWIDNDELARIAERASISPSFAADAPAAREDEQASLPKSKLTKSQASALPGSEQKRSTTIKGFAVPGKTTAPSKPLISVVERTSSAHTRSKAKIVDLDEETDSAAGLRSFAEPRQPDSEEDDSSSGSDSSDDDEAPGSEQSRGGVGEDSGLTMAESAINKLPSEARKRPPVYIMELSPLFRKSERRANRMALKHAEALIRKKAGWGGEVDENAADLAYSISSLQNPFRIKNFDAMKLGALTALILASPQIAAGAVIEQLFNPQYALLQRYCMLNALAFAAMELAGERVEHAASEDDQIAKLATSLSIEATSQAKEEGEARVPAIQREKRLKLNKASLLSGITPSSQGHGLTRRAAFPGALVRPSQSYVQIAASCFLHPLITRTWAHMQEANTRTVRSQGGCLGAGAGALFTPILVSRLLQTLAVLAHTARNAAEFISIIAPELLELVIGVARYAVPLAAAHQLDSEGGDAEDVGNTLQQSFASLALTVLTDLYAADQGKDLLKRHHEILLEIQQLMEGIFEREDARGGKASHPAAATLLRIAEIRDAWQSTVM